MTGERRRRWSDARRSSGQASRSCRALGRRSLFEARGPIFVAGPGGGARGRAPTWPASRACPLPTPRHRHTPVASRTPVGASGRCCSWTMVPRRVRTLPAERAQVRAATAADCVSNRTEFGEDAPRSIQPAAQALSHASAGPAYGLTIHIETPLNQFSLQCIHALDLPHSSVRVAARNRRRSNTVRH